MEQSEAINELAGALALAQGQMTGALKDTTNSFFNSKYADLAACWEACRKPLSDNKLAVIQTTAHKDGTIYVVTTLAHASGQWIRGWVPVRSKDHSAQAEGSGMTYARRYGLTAMVGIAQVDDDGESAQGREVNPAKHDTVLTKKQIAFAREFADSFSKTLNADVDDDTKAANVLSLRNEASEDQLVMVEAWKLLAAPERAAIKKLIAIAEKGTRNAQAI
jgi:hypothetical protein